MSHTGLRENSELRLEGYLRGSGEGPMTLFGELLDPKTWALERGKQ